MSWDVSIMHLPADVQSVVAIGEVFKLRPLGKRDDIIEKIREILPDVDFSDPSWGVLDQAGFTIEFNMGKEEICDSFMLHVRGGGDAIATIEGLLKHLQLRAVDCSTGDIFPSDAAHASLGRWQEYRNRVIRDQRTLE